MTTMKKDEILEMFKNVGMGDKVAPVTYTKWFSKQKEVSLEDIYYKVFNSQSKYKELLVDYLIQQGLPADYKTKPAIKDGELLEIILKYTGVQYQPPDRNMIEKIALGAGYSAKKSAFIARRACIEDGSVKPSSKYAKILAFIKGELK